LDRNKARRRPVHSDWNIRPEGVIPPFAPPPDTGRVRVAYHLRNNAWVYEPLERDRVPGRAIGANGSGDWAYDPDFAGGTYRDEAPGGGIVTPGAGSAGYGHGQRPLEGRRSGSGNPGHSEAGSGVGGGSESMRRRRPSDDGKSAGDKASKRRH
jgi:hypothetical protein